MPLTSLDELDSDLQTGMRGNNKNPIGTSAAGLAGVLPTDPSVLVSPCAQLKWLEENTPWRWEAFVSLSFDKGYQGLRATKKSDGTLVREVKFPITGGDDSSPYKQIPINHKRMMEKAMEFVAKKIGLLP